MSFWMGRINAAQNYWISSISYIFIQKAVKYEKNLAKNNRLEKSLTVLIRDEQDNNGDLTEVPVRLRSGPIECSSNKGENQWS